MPARKPVDWANYADNATRCSVLSDRPATWTVKKKKGMALCPLAAAVLVREGILSNKDLVLAQSLLERPTSPSSLLNPTDPLSAIIVSTYDVVGDILIGAAGGPLEVARQIGPARSSSLRREELARQSQDLICHGDGARSKNDTLMVGPKALVHYCSGTYKGVRKIVETGLKTPMTYTHSLTRGFHNMPGLYGERLREHEEIVDMKSGFAVSGKVCEVPCTLNRHRTDDIVRHLDTVSTMASRTSLSCRSRERRKKVLQGQAKVFAKVWAI